MSPSTILLLVCAIALVVWIGRQVRQFNRVPSPARPDRHLPAEEYRLLGDDYRDCVADYFRESRIRHTRNRFAVFSVTGADPEKNDAAGLPAPASRTKEIDSLASQK